MQLSSVLPRASPFPGGKRGEAAALSGANGSIKAPGNARSGSTRAGFVRGTVASVTGAASASPCSSCRDTEMEMRGAGASSLQVLPDGKGFQQGWACSRPGGCAVTQAVS